VNEYAQAPFVQSEAPSTYVRAVVPLAQAAAGGDEHAVSVLVYVHEPATQLAGVP